MAMEQLRIGLPPRDATSPVSRLVMGMVGAVLAIAVVAVVLFVILPLVGVIVSAAVGGMILALAGVVMMIPFVLLAATILVLSRSHARRQAAVRRRSPGV